LDPDTGRTLRKGAYLFQSVWNPFKKAKKMVGEILSTGDEIRTGALVDSNSAYIAERLEIEGIAVVRHMAIGDDLGTIVSVLKEIGTRADVAVVTGGLGPTLDDLTTEAAAKAADVGLSLDRVALETIEGFFRKMNRSMSDSNKKQAMFPEGAERLDNPIGTAPGFMLRIDRCVFFFLPGVPAEMQLMLSDQVLPRIRALLGEDRSYLLVKTLSTFGLPESVVGERLRDLADGFPDIKLGLRAKFPEIQIKLYVKGEDEAQLNGKLGRASSWVIQHLGKNVFSADGISMEAAVGELLKEKGATVAVAESCTGGLISDWLTDVPGSSAYFLFSAVTYSNESKNEILGVMPETLSANGAVDEAVVSEMAEGVRRISGATYGVATSGIAGPDGGTAEKPVGTVCIGIATPERTEGRRFYFPFGNRSRNKKMFAMTALNMLRRELLASDF
jgi:competence/damage-inducible protein CinA-like protein